MKLARNDRSLIAWMLYLSILFSALACAVGHGQMAALQLSGLGGQFCSVEGNAAPAGSLDADGSGLFMASPTQAGGCALGSLFSAFILAAFFGLLGLLAADVGRPLYRFFPTRTARYRWPPANPRASPCC